MTKPIRDDIIDNRRTKMGDVMNSYLPVIEHLDVSTGYFDLGGYTMVRDKLEDALKRPGFRFRLLMGTNSITDKNPKSFEELVEKITGSAPPDIWSSPVEDATPLNSYLAAMNMESGQGSINGLRNMLNKDSVQVRYGKSRFNHSKCYILGEGAAIIGSSNFTSPGFGGVDGSRYNYELNASLKQKLSVDHVQEWFDDMWEMADDAKQDLIDILKDSKFGDPPKPFQIYLQMVFEKYKQRFIDNVRASEGTDSTEDLAPFQTEAVFNAMQIMDVWGGVLVSDSVGLGKTHIGLDIIRREILARRRVMLVAPRQVLDTVWKPKLKDTQFNVEMVGMEEMGRSGFADTIGEYRKIDTILVDESHGFRNGDSGRHGNMMKLVTVRKRRVVLMSATPYNNTLLDIYQQMLIIAGGDESRFADLGIPHMREYFKNIIRQGSESALNGVQPLLEAVMVRRTREYIKDKYPNTKLGGRKIKFPERRYESIHYTTPFSGIYKEVAETIKGLHMTPYGLEYYNMTLSDEERYKKRVLAHLQNVLLIKRFESSMEAVDVSLRRMKRLYDTMYEIFDRKRMVTRGSLKRVMDMWDRLEASGREDAGEVQEFDYILREIKEEDSDTSDYDMDMIKEHMIQDKKQLDKLILRIGKMRPFDKKLDAVADRILVDGALERDGKKVLLFTEYTDTAKYVYDRLREKFPNHKTLLLTGSMNKDKRRKIIQMFAPNANDAVSDGVDERANILVSTEVLAEGQNLQDCNYIINYDLPWNPVRIVQRVGRLDRLTSEWDVLYSRQCFPEDELNEQVDLKGIVLSKVNDISDLGLLDANLLGVEANPKQFDNALSKLKVISGSNRAAADMAWGELEAEADLFPKSSYLDILKKYADRAFVNRMSREPLGRRSGVLQTDGPPAAILAYRHGRADFYTVVYRYDEDKASVMDSIEAFKLVSCREDTATHLPMDTDGASGESFRHLLAIDGVARKSIAKRSSQDRIERIGKPDKDYVHMKSVIKRAMKSGLLSADDAGFVYRLMDSGKLRWWYKDLEEQVDSLNKAAVQKLVANLRRDFSEQESRRTRATDIKPDELVLVGALFLTGETFESGMYWAEQ